jgi:drug/metabolite transporter (DMT)-like permease
MRIVDVARLLALAALWGGSFLFMRVAVLPLGPIATAELRVLLAATTLVVWLRAAGIPLGWRGDWQLYVVVGVINSAAPFALWAFSARHLPVSYLVVINATSPIFGALVSALWLGDRFTPRAALGLAAGVGGVALLVGVGPVQPTPEALWALVAGALGSLCYAIAAAYLKRREHAPAPAAVATGSQLAATVALLPLLPALPPVAWPAPGEWTAVLMLGVVCTAIPYLLYFRLIADVGATRALTVTFLIPVFGMLWGAIFLGETITGTMAAGCGLVLLGTALVFARPGEARASAVAEPGAAAGERTGR